MTSDSSLVRELWVIENRAGRLHYCGRLSEVIEDVENQFNDRHNGNATLKRLYSET
jgi:hypothetical protein